MVPGNLPSQLDILSAGQTYYQAHVIIHAPKPDASGLGFLAMAFYSQHVNPAT